MHRQTAFCTETTGKHISFSHFYRLETGSSTSIILRIMDYSVLFRIPVITGEVSGQAVHQYDKQKLFRTPYLLG